MEAQMKMQKASVVTMPTDGLIWSITGKSGEQANSNALVMEVINPSRIWVDAFFSERHAKELKPGLPATIRSLDSTASWRGHLESIRAGVGRIAYDTTVAIPPPEMAKRQIAVRVDVDWQPPFGAVEFFGVGRSVEVKFVKGKGSGRWAMFSRKNGSGHLRSQNARQLRRILANESHPEAAQPRIVPAAPGRGDRDGVYSIERADG